MGLVARPIHELYGRLGAEGAFDLYWSEELLAELLAVLQRHRGFSAVQAQRVAGFVRAGFPGCEISVTEMRAFYAEALALVRDPRDAHVAALAVQARAALLLTFDRRGYLAEPLRRHGVELLSPDAFLVELDAEIPADIERILALQVARRTVYPATLHDLLSLLYRAGCTQ